MATFKDLNFILMPLLNYRLTSPRCCSYADPCYGHEHSTLVDGMLHLVRYIHWTHIGESLRPEAAS